MAATAGMGSRDMRADTAVRQGESRHAPRRSPRAWRGAVVADQGFALIEVLAAVAVLGLVLGAVGMIVAVTLAGIRSAADRVLLTEASRTLLATLPHDGTLRVGTTTGVIGTTHWRIDVAPKGGEAPPPRPSDDDDEPPGWRPASVTILAQTARGRSMRLDTVGLIRRTTP